jgi:hypothetical protein
VEVDLPDDDDGERGTAAHTDDRGARAGLGVVPTEVNAMPLFGDKNKRALTEYTNQVLADDILSEEEEQAFLEHANSLGVETFTKYPEILNRLMIARVNDGRLPVIPDPRLLAKAGETVYLETEAILMKEVTVREWQGSGFSFPIAMGIRYRTSRGQMKAVGTRIEPADAGQISVTDRRVVFSGSKKSQESLYAKLNSLQVFSDGISLGVSNRQNVSTYKLVNTTGEVVAAVINAAMQRVAL